MDILRVCNCLFVIFILDKDSSVRSHGLATVSASLFRLSLLGHQVRYLAYLTYFLTLGVATHLFLYIDSSILIEVLQDRANSVVFQLATI